MADGMAASKCTDLQQAVLKHFLKAGGAAAEAQPAGLYVALCSADPGEAGSLTNELTNAGGYARQPVTFGAVGAGSGTASRTANTADILWPQASAAYSAPVSHWVIVDAASGAPTRRYYYGPITAGGVPTTKTIGQNDQFKIPAGSITVDED